MTWTVIQGDSRAVLAEGEENEVDAVVCDPPYELGFMGKKWDNTGIAFDPEFWKLVLRVLKPGGHLLAFSGSRTSHRMVCAIEDAGFEVRDSLQWIYATGFPKSLDIAKAIDKQAGYWRGKAGSPVGDVRAMGQHYEQTPKGDPITAAAAAWDGWGTALKPAFEPICLARKPLHGTVTENVVEWGTGGLNIDACRIGDEVRHNAPAHTALMRPYTSNIDFKGTDVTGRWPANVLLDAEAARLLDEQVGSQVSRFFYCSKTSRAEREAGCEHLPAKTAAETVDREEGSAGIENPRAGAGRTGKEIRNGHPTVKPVALMRWLVRLITPPGGMVLDPFTGSGTTGIAAVKEGHDFIGIEQSEEYVAIARARIENAEKTSDS